jgi:hypothetical protein
MFNTYCRTWLIAILTAVLFGCGGEADEAKKLGFASLDEMKEAHAKGWHTQQQYYKDNPSLAKQATAKHESEIKKSIPQTAAASTRQQYRNDSNGRINDEIFNSWVQLVEARLPGFLDEKNKRTEEELCKNVHRSFTNKLQILYEAITYQNGNAIEAGISLGRINCQREKFPGDGTVAYSSRDLNAREGYDLVLRECFVGGSDAQIKMIEKITRELEAPQDCQRINRLRKGQYVIVMDPKFGPR